MLCSGGFAQHPVGSLLVIQLENQTGYVRDVSDTTAPSRRPGPHDDLFDRGAKSQLRRIDLRWRHCFRQWKAGQGTATELVIFIPIRPSPTTGQFIGDTTRGGFYEWNFEILHEDGRQIGSIRASGMGQGQPPPGATSAVRAASYAVIGGTGAFLGSAVIWAAAVGRRHPLRCESLPQPKIQPTDVCTVVDLSFKTCTFCPCSAQKSSRRRMGPRWCTPPISRSLQAPNLPGQGKSSACLPLDSAPRFRASNRASPLLLQRATLSIPPVEVLVNGKPAEVLYAGGYPGAVDRYQVNFRVPDGITAGMASVQLSSAWITGPEVKIPIQ